MEFRFRAKSGNKTFDERHIVNKRWGWFGKSCRKGLSYFSECRLVGLYDIIYIIYLI